MRLKCVSLIVVLALIGCSQARCQSQIKMGPDRSVTRGHSVCGISMLLQDCI